MRGANWTAIMALSNGNKILCSFPVFRLQLPLFPSVWQSAAKNKYISDSVSNVVSGTLKSKCVLGFFKPCLSADQSWRLLGWFPVSHPAGCWQLAGIINCSASVWNSQHYPSSACWRHEQDCGWEIRLPGSKKWVYIRGAQYLTEGPGQEQIDGVFAFWRPAVSSMHSLKNLPLERGLLAFVSGVRYLLGKRGHHRERQNKWGLILKKM